MVKYAINTQTFINKKAVPSYNNNDGDIVGRIKTKLVKRITNELISRYPDKVKDNFEENKKAVNELTDIQSKKIKNTIAGYVSKKIKAQKQ